MQITQASNSAVPVTIITGFLGSGKTTTLNRLLQRPSLADTAVIVNEFGEVGLDHLLIEQAIENTVLLKNGCICCSVRGDVADTLEGLWAQRAAGTIPPFSRVVIETTGLADPGSVAHALIAEPGAGYNCRLDGIVTAFDAVHGRRQLRERDEVRRQVGLADAVLLTKTDLAGPTEAAAARAAIAHWNPTAPVVAVLDGAVDDQFIFGLTPAGPVPPERIAAWLHGSDAQHPHHDHHHGHFHHDTAITSVLLTHDRPVPWPALARWLDSVLSLRGAQVMRLKGLVDLEGEARPVVLQAVHHVVHARDHLPAWPGPRRTDLVVIHDGLPEAGLRQSFADALSA